MTDNPFHSENPATRAKALRDSFAAKAASRPEVDSQGKPTAPLTDHTYDDFGRLVSKGGPAA